jgi:hypothetical protein
MEQTDTAAASAAPHEWGVPDWRDAAAYEYTKALAGDERLPAQIGSPEEGAQLYAERLFRRTPEDAIRWEFLRRTPVYRRLYAEAADTGDLNATDYGLSQWVAPETRGDCLPAGLRFTDSMQAGGILSAPESGHDVEQQALDIGLRVLELMNQGYAVAVFDPWLDFDAQQKRVQDGINAIRAEAKNKAVERGKKKPSVQYADRDAHPLGVAGLLRVLDAYNAEGLRPGEKAPYGVKKGIYDAIFRSNQDHESPAKTLDDAYTTALKKGWRVRVEGGAVHL